MVVHEAVHIQQPDNMRYFSRRISNGLLMQSIKEGAADFITSLIINEITNTTLHKYGNINEQVLWEEFQQEMFDNDLSRWLYQGNQSKFRPADLGYYIGFKICESYYHNHQDKSKAIKEIITVKNYRKFLKKSKYGEKYK
jgi:uncharacterized protein YjaZ